MAKTTGSSVFAAYGRFHYLVFHGVKVMLCTGANTYTLQNKEITGLKSNLTLETTSVKTAIDSKIIQLSSPNYLLFYSNKMVTKNDSLKWTLKSLTNI